MSLATGTSPFLAVLAVASVSFASFRLYGWQAAKSPPKQAVRRLRRAFGIGLPTTGLAALFAAVLTDALGLTDDLIRAASPALADSPVGAVLTWVPTLAGVVVAVLAGYLGAFPYVRDLRDVEMSAADAATRFGRWLVVFLGLVVATVGVIGLLPTSVVTATLPLLGVLALVVVVVLVVQPRIVSVSQTTRTPTDAERDRIDRLAERAGVSARGVTVVETGGSRTATAMVAGLPGRRRLFVTDHLLGTFDDGVVVAALASKAGRTRYYYREYKLAAVLVGTGLALGATTGDFGAVAALGTLEFLALLVGVLVGLSWVGKRLLLAADDYAAERIGVETYVDALDEIADEHQLSYESGRLASLVRMAPSLGARLDRLRGQFEE